MGAEEMLVEETLVENTLVENKVGQNMYRQMLYYITCFYCSSPISLSVSSSWIASPSLDISGNGLAHGS